MQCAGVTVYLLCGSWICCPVPHVTCMPAQVSIAHFAHVRRVQGLTPKPNKNQNSFFFTLAPGAHEIHGFKHGVAPKVPATHRPLRQIESGQLLVNKCVHFQFNSLFGCVN